MTKSEAAEIIRQHNLWRRDLTGEIEMGDVTQLGLALEMAIDALAPMPPIFDGFPHCQMNKEAALRILVRAGITDAEGNLTGRFSG